MTEMSPTRFYVQAKAYDRFPSRFSEKVAATKVGTGFDEGVQMGPLCHARRVTTMEGFVQNARDRGAEIVTGGNRIGKAGYFYAPTVVASGSDALNWPCFLRVHRVEQSRAAHRASTCRRDGQHQSLRPGATRNAFRWRQ